MEASPVIRGLISYCRDRAGECFYAAYEYSEEEITPHYTSRTMPSDDIVEEFKAVAREAYHVHQTLLRDSEETGLGLQRSLLHLFDAEYCAVQLFLPEVDRQGGVILLFDADVASRHNSFIAECEARVDEALTTGS